MELTTKHIRLIQNELNKMGLNAGTVDGIAGDATKTALLKVPGNTNTWPFKRQAVAFIQFLSKKYGFNPGPIDGFWGPQTSTAFDDMSEFLDTGIKPAPWRDDTPKVSFNPNNWPMQRQDALIAFYGQPGDSNQLTRIQLPYPHKLAWEKRTILNSFTCHKKVHDSMKAVLTKVLEVYGIEEIQRLGLDIWSGCVNVRQMRGGTEWSMHSWGIAVDYDDTNNQLKWGRDRARFARPEYDKWWQCWEEEGWESLGRKKNYDWMHVQAAKIF
jgi:hypothetical protein